MNQQALLLNLHQANESEQFYFEYYQAKRNNSLDTFLAKLDMEKVYRMHLLIPEIENTIPPEYLEEWFFDITTKQNIYVQKHNCFSPDILHRHKFFEFFYVLEGSCTQEISGIKIQMQAGDICLIPPDISHRIAVFDESIIIDILIRKSTFEDIFFNFLRSDNILSSFFLSSIYLSHANDYIIFHTKADAGIKELILDIFLESVNRHQYYHELINSQLLTLFARVLRNYEQNCDLPPFTKKKDAQGYGLIRYIQDNYREVSLESVSERFHFTPEYTSKLIKNLTGHTYTQILQKIRLDRAQALLTDTNIPVGDIGHEVGYPNPEHFIRVFKKAFGVTPSGFRRAHH